VTIASLSSLPVSPDCGRWRASSDKGGAARRDVAAPWQWGNMRLSAPTGSHHLRRQCARTDATYNGRRRVHPTSIEEKWVPINRPGARPPPEKKVIFFWFARRKTRKFFMSLGHFTRKCWRLALGYVHKRIYAYIHTRTHNMRSNLIFYEVTERMKLSTSSTILRRDASYFSSYLSVNLKNAFFLLPKRIYKIIFYWSLSNKALLLLLSHWTSYSIYLNLTGGEIGFSAKDSTVHWSRYKGNWPDAGLTKIKKAVLK